MLLLLFDFGLLILIWIIQLVVYPSFTRMQESNLLNWHSSYSKRISIIVIPLMIGQFGLHVFGLTQATNGWQLTAMVLVILAWANTFFFAVPIHNKIANGIDLPNATQKLVMVNWWRTSFWTAVFIIDASLYLKLCTS